ncbi:hypothetical protein BZG73_10685 [Salinivibrio siamensis]|uniref:C2H2-type domain-containing protein n=1 Tax=Salinivibrio siamensis TaxID=414286 RepID=A0ABX3K7H0_9GAMM|nr:hypothetical protein BZG73_10685 [Salinivibrio siamensis]
MYTNITFDCECGSVVREGAFYPVHIADTEKEREQFQETESEVECDSCGRPYHVLITGKTHEDPRHAWGSELMTKLLLKVKNRVSCHVY